MDRRDWVFLYVAMGLSIISGLVIYCNYNSSNSNAISFWVSVVSAFITIIGFGFTILLQLKIKGTSHQIKENSDRIYKNLKKDLSNYHLSKAVNLATEIEDKILHKDHKSALTLVKQLQETLVECNKIYSVDLIKHLSDCFNCGDFTKKTMPEILEECRNRSEAESNEELKEMSIKLATHCVNLNSQISSKDNIFVPKILVQDMENLKILLNSAKTSALNLFI